MKTILITGGNKGIGLETARQLLKSNQKVIITSRDHNRGLNAIRDLGFKEDADLLELDVSDPKSISDASDELKKRNIKLDVIINNAAILIDNSKIDSMPLNIFLDTYKTNTLGPILVTQKFLPHMNTKGRIINVSSGLGSLSDMEDYSPAYSISKAALNAVTKQFASVLNKKNISVNSVCPGWVRTDMGGRNASRSVEKGAETIVWLALEAPQKLTGKFLRDKKEIDW